MHPNPDDGLRGDRLLTEALAPFTDDAHAATDPGIYLLRCCSPGDSLEVHARAWRGAGYRDAHPEEMERFASAEKLIYVGAIAGLIGYVVGDSLHPVRYAAAKALREMGEALEEDVNDGE